MALIVEDGSNVSGSNTYNTDAELQAYALARGYTLPATETDRDILQIKAMDFINYNEPDMQGYRVTSDQSVSFPRTGVVVNSFLIESDQIPDTLKKAQNEAAIASQTVDLLTNESISNVQKEKVDVIEKSYFKGGNKTSITLDTVYNYLSPVLNDVNKLVRT